MSRFAPTSCLAEASYINPIHTVKDFFSKWLRIVRRRQARLNGRKGI